MSHKVSGRAGSNTPVLENNSQGSNRNVHITVTPTEGKLTQVSRSQGSPTEAKLARCPLLFKSIAAGLSWWRSG